MPAPVVSISTKRHGYWSLLEVAQAGKSPVPYGILLVDQETGQLSVRMRDFTEFGELEEDEFDWLQEMTADLEQRAREMGGLKVLDWLEDTASNYLRISDREAIAFSGEDAVLNQLFDEHVDSTVRPFITHLPVYSLRAAATRFGEGMDVEQESWVRVSNVTLREGMFVAHVVGKSMEPLIPDGSACIFRSPVTGSRQGRNVLIEQFGEADYASRYTVKRYARHAPLKGSDDREQPIRLEPLNPEFEAFDLTSDHFRVIAEFVQVLPL